MLKLSNKSFADIQESPKEYLDALVGIIENIDIHSYSDVVLPSTFMLFLEELRVHPDDSGDWMDEFGSFRNTCRFIDLVKSGIPILKIFIFHLEKVEHQEGSGFVKAFWIGVIATFNYLVPNGNDAVN